MPTSIYRRINSPWAWSLGAVVIAFLLVIPWVVSTVRAQTGGLAIIGGPTVDAAGVTETSVSIFWRTNKTSTGSVEFGLTETLGSTADEVAIGDSLGSVLPVITDNHNVALWELKPGTKYYYRVTSEIGLDIPGGPDTVRSAILSFTTSGTPGNACVEDVWQCADWSVCSADAKQSRKCELETDCPGADSVKPIESQACQPACVEDVWQCADWSVCSADAKQSRKCELETDCPGVTTVRPAEAQECELPPVNDATSDPDGDSAEGRTDSSAVDDPSDPEGDSAEGRTGSPDSGSSLLDDMAGSASDFNRALSGGGSDGAAAIQAALSGDLPDPDELCRNNGINPERCFEWLKAKFADDSCADNGLTTRESCDKFLTERNGGTFPGCEGKNEDECRAIKALKLVGYLSAEARDAVDEALKSPEGRSRLAAAGGTLAISGDAAADIDVWPAAPGEETSDGVMVFDSDHDGLPDDVERILGTDPDNTDTDGDGASDAEELKGGTDPLGVGTMGRELSSVERLFIAGTPLEQPLGAGEVDDTFILGVDGLKWDTPGALAPPPPEKPTRPEVIPASPDPSRYRDADDQPVPPVENTNRPITVPKGISDPPKEKPKASGDASGSRLWGPPVEYPDVNAPPPGFTGPDAGGNFTPTPPPTKPKPVVMSGRCAPDTTCLLYVYSYVPLVLTTTTDVDGNWRYSLDGNILSEGPHTVYVAEVDDAGKIVKKSNPLSLFIKEAQAVTSDDYLRADMNVPSESGAQYQMYYLAGVFALVVLALGAIVFLQKRPKVQRQE